VYDEPDRPPVHPFQIIGFVLVIGWILIALPFSGPFAFVQPTHYQAAVLLAIGIPAMLVSVVLFFVGRRRRRAAWYGRPLPPETKE
jgi:hypothetical protein